MNFTGVHIKKHIIRGVSQLYCNVSSGLELGLKVTLIQAVIVKDPRNNLLFPEKANRRIGVKPAQHFSMSFQYRLSRLGGPKYQAFLSLADVSGAVPQDLHLEAMGL